MNSRTDTNSHISQRLSKRQELLEILLREEGLDSTFEKIPKRNQQTEIPQSYAQQRLWFLDRLEPGNAVYNIWTAYRLRGPLNIRILNQSLNEVIRRHESLRTAFTELDGEPIQNIALFTPFTLPTYTMQQSSEVEKQARRLVLDEIRRPFDLNHASLFRAMLLRLADQEHILVITMHHIISDAWSIGLLFHEVQILYHANLNGSFHRLPELPIQYADFSVWQRDWIQGKHLEQQLSYWIKKLNDAPRLMKLPTDHPRPPAMSYRGSTKTLVLSSALSNSLRELIQQEGMTSFMVLLAAFATLLHRYSGEKDLLIGSPISGRSRMEVERLIGLFVNTLVFRIDVSGKPTFRELLGRVRTICLEGYSNQDVPFETLVERLRPERGLDHSPLFQVMFDLQKSAETLNLPGVNAEWYRAETGTAKFDLTLSIIEGTKAFELIMEYSTDLFEGGTIQRMLGHFQSLLASIVANPNQRISNLPLMTEEELRRLIIGWNGTGNDFAGSACIHHIFERQVEVYPDAIATIFEDQKLTYRELNERANQLAHYLQNRGVGPEVMVGLCIERSLEMLIGMLAILKAGGAYVPLDPRYPEERLAYIIAETGLITILTQQHLQNRLRQQNASMLNVDLNSSDIFIEQPTHNLNVSATPDNLAYVMFTSGSTGNAKGVAVVHRAVIRLVKNTDYAHFGPNEIILQFAPISFDASTFEIWGALLNGGRLVIHPPQVPSLDEFTKTLKLHHITTLWLTAGLFHEIMESDPTSLQTVTQLLAGGDVLSVSLVKKFLAQLKEGRLINGYGPTENTTFTCCYSMDQTSSLASTVPIGRPIANTTVYVLDEELQPVPIGVPGQLYAAGQGLARGYLNDPGLTSEKFVPNSFDDQPEARMYATGDLVRYLPDGNIEFIRRIDHQVKIRGFRVEPAEIESAINDFPGIQASLAIPLDDSGGNKRIVAYVVGAKNASLDLTDLRSFLKQKLPDYMLPSAFMVLPSIPLTPNGKIDRSQLPVPGDSKSAEPEYMPARDELEFQLTKIWEKVLGVKRVGVHDNFFDLGGHSLLAIKLFIQVERLTGKNLPLATLFQAPTIEKLAHVLRDSGWTPPWSSLVAIQPSGSNPPLYCVHGVGGNIAEYLHLARHLGADQPFYGLQAQGLDGKAPRHNRVEDMADHYIKEIRTFQAEGPYYLAGGSFGGLVAYEMASRLVAAGQKVALLALFDTNAPGYPKYLPGTTLFKRKLNYQKQRLLFHATNLRLLEPENRVEYIHENSRKARSLMLRRFRILQRKAQNLFLRRPLKAVQDSGREALRKYVAPRYEGKLILFRASKQPLGIYPDLTLGWSKFAAGELQIIEIRGYHGLVREPVVRVLASRLTECLKEARDI